MLSFSQTVPGISSTSWTSLTQSFLLSEHVSDVSEVNAWDNLLWILDWHTRQDIFPRHRIVGINRWYIWSVTHHIDKQLPQRLQENDGNRLWVMRCRVKFCFSNTASNVKSHLAFGPCPQVPHSIEHSSSSQLDHSFLWAQLCQRRWQVWHSVNQVDAL